MLYWCSPADSWTTAIYGCFNCLCKCVCARASPICVCAAHGAHSLLLALSSFASHSAAANPPAPQRVLSTFHSQEEEQSFCFPPPTHSPLQPYSFAQLLSALTKSLFRLDTAENHMACDITGAGSEERGMVEGWGGLRLACQVSVQ